MEHYFSTDSRLWGKKNTKNNNKNYNKKQCFESRLFRNLVNGENKLLNMHVLIFLSQPTSSLILEINCYEEVLLTVLPLPIPY